MTRGWTTTIWTALTAIAVLWPAHAVGPLDGAPLDASAEAILIGLVLPSLWWMDRRALTTTWARALVVVLLTWKAATTLLLTQQGLCAAAFAPSPLHGVNQGIPIEEPSGALRSWDLRADLLAPAPTCTAILTRPLPTQSDFPAWFLNITDPMLKHRDFTMSVKGYLSTASRQRLTIDADPSMQLTGRVDQQPLSAAPLELDAGTHELDLSLTLRAASWRFDPRLDGRPLWDRATVTIRPPTAFDRLLGSWAWAIAPIAVLLLIAGLLGRAARRMRPNLAVVAWIVVASAAAAALAWLDDPLWNRAAGVITVASLIVPVAGRLRNLRGAFLLIGVPWLVFFVSRSLDQIGRFSIYSQDDWLTYQVAGHRIYLQGHWIEGGNAAFDFQPFYRWMTGALHLVFGDSSVGELYWDAAALLIGALLAFQIARTVSGFRAGLFAASAALATYLAGTSWHFIGRGLSEIAAAGWAFLAMFLVLRGRRGALTWVVAASVFATLMFYTRLNHLLFGPFLVALLLPLRAMSVPTSLIRGLRRVRRRAAAMVTGGFAIGVLLFAIRTWYFTGVFSLFYGTSLRHNDTGLRPWTLFDGDVWSRVIHSLWALVWMNEPTRPDARAIVLAIGAVVAIAALVQLPIARRVPAALLIVTIGATIGSFFAHVHAYPGRMSIHLIPLASALTAIAMASAASAIGASRRATSRS